MSILTIPIEELRRLVGLEAGDASADAALTAVQAAEQPAHEYALDVNALNAAQADAGLMATLTLGVAQLLAGSYLQQTARAAGATDDITIGGLQIAVSRTQSPGQLGEQLVGQGTARLSPYVRGSGAGTAVPLLAAAFGLGLDSGTEAGTLDQPTPPGNADGTSGAWALPGGALCKETSDEEARCP